MLNPKIVKAGPITMALGLIVFGSVMLINNFVENSLLLNAWKLWPLLLVGLGVEFLIRDTLRKKSSEPVELRFSALSILLIGVLIFAGFTTSITYRIAGSTEFDQVIKENIFGNAVHYNKTFEEEPIELKETGTKFSLDNKNGQVNIKPSLDNKIHIKGEIVAYASSKEEAEQRAEEVRIDVQSDSGVYVKSILPGYIGSNGNIRVNYEIMLPKGMIIYLNNDIGEVAIDDIEGSLAIDSNVGKTLIKNLTGDLTVDSGTGSINVNQVSGKLKLHTNTGRIEITEPGSEVTATTNTGRIEMMSSNPLDNSYNISTKTGRIEITIPKESNLKVDAFTNTGGIDAPEQITVERDGSQQSAEGELGNGEGVLKLQTKTGRINIGVN